MDNRDISNVRLANQRISASELATPLEVVSHMGAIQAQDYGQALWAVGLRLREGTVADVERAIADHAIVRTWPMRGTLHFIPAQDVTWMVKLLAMRGDAGLKARLRELELDEKTLSKSLNVLGEALRGGKAIERKEIMQTLDSAGIATAHQRGIHILGWAARQGHICLGPGKSTFVLADEWLPQQRELSGDEALAEIAQRYFGSHGPATIQDFASWSGLKMADAKKGLTGADLEEVCEGSWQSADSVGAELDDSTYVLPSFDEYTVIKSYRLPVVDPDIYDHIFGGKNGMIPATVVSHGTVVGTWKRVIKKNTVDFSFSIMNDNLVDYEELKEKARAYCSFMNLTLGELRF